MTPPQEPRPDDDEYPPGYWTPVTEAHIDELYLAAILGEPGQGPPVDTYERGIWWGYPECCARQWADEFSRPDATLLYAKRGVKVVDGGLVPHEPIYSAYIPCDECMALDEPSRRFFHLLDDASVHAYLAYCGEIMRQRGERTDGTGL